ncbi:hypothetical protein PCYB_132450 [Plasmodium cynomolgi strain B]|uniref:CYIR protein n=1 Tax=Plasmodium cynomolgi (strain B) TaxID=1120755 RepID=K6V047_PLACD|nr:hypothetical protein PCYB_132450 [Plasmodium cynomolgi strain B]GAB68370.1 hypothetical protein PCYB_132450 [Plasmodium cynomolgi strain B]
MKLNLLLLNCLIFDAGGVSEEAIKKLKEIKKLELDILKDFVKQDTTHADLYKKYHCIASDYISVDPKKGRSPKETDANNHPKKNKTEEQNLEEKGEKSKKSFIQKIVSFVSIFSYDNVSKFYSEHVQKTFSSRRDHADSANGDNTIYGQDKTEIEKKKLKLLRTIISIKFNKKEYVSGR